VTPFKPPSSVGREDLWCVLHCTTVQRSLQAAPLSVRLSTSTSSPNHLMVNNIMVVHAPLAEMALTLLEIHTAACALFDLGCLLPKPQPSVICSHSTAGLERTWTGLPPHILSVTDTGWQNAMSGAPGWQCMGQVHGWLVHYIVTRKETRLIKLPDTSHLTSGPCCPIPLT